VAQSQLVEFGPTASAAELGWLKLSWLSGPTASAAELGWLKLSWLGLDLLQRQQIGPAEIQRVWFGADAEALKSAAQTVDSSSVGGFHTGPPLASWSHLVAISTALVCLKEYIIFPSECTVFVFNTINKIDNSYAYRQCRVY
jgi:hypothetical protein